MSNSHDTVIFDEENSMSETSLEVAQIFGLDCESDDADDEQHIIHYMPPASPDIGEDYGDFTAQGKETPHKNHSLILSSTPCPDTVVTNDENSLSETSLKKSRIVWPEYAKGLGHIEVDNYFETPPASPIKEAKLSLGFYVPLPGFQ